MSNRLWVGVVSLLISCGGVKSNNQVDASSPGSDASVLDALTADQGCETQSNDRCMKLQMCSPVDLEKRFGDLATCEAREKLGCLAGLAAPDTGNSAEQVTECGEAVLAEACIDFLQKSAPNACLKQMGTSTGGCAFPAQCPTAFCAIDDTELCGTCAAQPSAGTSCATNGCGQGLICVASTQMCEVARDANQACDKTQPCANGLNCVGATATASGTCKPQVESVGGTCDPTHKTTVDCDDDAGLTCNTTTLKCVTQPIAQVGQACGPNNGVRTACASASSCVIQTGQTIGTCVATAADGGACDTDVGPNCFFPAKCVVGTGTAGTCQLAGSMTCQ